MREEDREKARHNLNNLLKDKRRGPKIRRGIYGRIIFVFLLIAIQVAILVFFVLKLRSYIEYYFGGSLLLSILFVIYLTNRAGKVEFKLSWVILLLISPLIGIVSYIIFHTDIGSKKIKKRLEYMEDKTCELSPSKEQCDAVLNKYKDAKGLGEYLLYRGKAAPHDFTKVKYFSCGEDFFPDFCEGLRTAKKFIFMEFFIIDVDESWIKVFDILKEKIDEGVEVRLMYDGFGATTLATKKYQKFLAENGFDSHIFMPLIPFFAVHLNNRDHRKITVIDGEIAYTGGFNITNEYFNIKQHRFDYWKDNGLRVEGPAILNYTQLFLQTWNLQTKVDDDYEKYLSIPYTKYESDGLVIPYGDDVYNNEDIAEDVYTYIMNNSKNYLHITSPYMVYDHQIQDALIFAARRGVDVKVIVPSTPDHMMTWCVSQTFIKTLVDSGVRVFNYERGFIHAKTFISDDKISTVGSVNLDYRSLYHHYETNTLMYKNSAIADIEKDFNDTLKYCKEIMPGDYKKLPVRKRFIGRVLRIVAPLL